MVEPVLAVRDCLFRGCPWHTDRTSTEALPAEDAERQVRAHLLDVHRRELTVLGALAETGQ